MQNITTPQCDHCPKKTEHPTKHRTTVLHTDHTTHRTTVLSTDHTTHRTAVLPTDHTTHRTTVLPTDNTTHRTTVLPTDHTTHRTTVLPTDNTTHRTTVLPTDHTSHRTTVLPTNRTTQRPSPPPKPTEYIVVNLAGEVCLRIKAIIKVMVHFPKIETITFPSPPITEVSGSCNDDIARLSLKDPKRELYLIFKEVWRAQTGGGV
ncbi:hepatitis A virus cellular receptor 1-like [Rana temporaria]|uniref:hepatitis A virus cellular receptor 1-like n=1 Tax=Rana temporaria TaxID=8407 RepID=UPI001AAD34A5|nr:hepatitis A virus cellular receptor 1-like [Rana temporaria]